MADFFDDLTFIRAAASAPIKADIDSLVNQINAVKMNLDSAKTKEQIDTALENSKYYEDRASRYKSTKLYADTVKNNAENKLYDFNNFETAIQGASDYLSANEYMNKKEEWENLNSLSKKREYDSVMDFIIDEQKKVSGWMTRLGSVDKDGRVSMNFRYNKAGYGSDMDIINQLGQYSRRLQVALEGVVFDGYLSPEEASLAFIGDKELYKGIKKTKLAEARDEIKSSRNDILKVDRLLADSKNDGGFLQMAYQMMSFEELEDAELDGTLGQDGQPLVNADGTPVVSYDSFKSKLETYKRKRQGDSTTFEDLYETWDGMPYGGIKSDVPSDVDEVPEMEFDDFDTRDKEQIEFEKLPLEEQKVEIEKRKKIAQEKYDKEQRYLESKVSDYEKIEKLKKLGSETIVKESGKYTGAGERQPGTFFKPVEKPMTSQGYIKSLMDEMDAPIDAEAIDEWLNIDTDKAGLALNDYMLGQITLLAASNKASPEISKVKKDIEKRGGKPFGARKQTGFRWNKEAKKLDEFKRKFKKFLKETGLSLKEFIQQNAAEYRNIARTLKYSKYGFKSHA